MACPKCGAHLCDAPMVPLLCERCARQAAIADRADFWSRFDAYARHMSVLREAVTTLIDCCSVCGQTVPDGEGSDDGSGLLCSKHAAEAAIAEMPFSPIIMDPPYRLRGSKS